MKKWSHIFAKLIRGKFFKCETSDDIGYCNYSLCDLLQSFYDFDSFILLTWNVC